MKKLIITLTILLSLISTTVLAFNFNDQTKNTIVVDKNEQVMLDSPLFTKKENYQKHLQDKVDMEADGFLKASTLGDLEMYYHPKTAAIRVKNIKTEYVWATDLLHIDKYDKILNNTQTKLAQTAFELTYLDEKGQAQVRSLYAGDRETIVSPKVSGNKIRFDVKNNKFDFKFSYTITLTKEGINLKLDHESIKENEKAANNPKVKKYYISDIKFFPYLGATYKNETPGYIFIPSGNGALVRYDNEIAINRSYKESYYGVDANRVQNEERDPLSLPVYGVCHGVKQHALFTNINEGSEIASLNFDPSSTQLGFNKIYNSYSFRDTYIITIPGTDTTVTMIPENIYKTNIDVDFSFLADEEASYIGMAKHYQKKLVDDNILTKNNGSTKVNIDVLGGETKSGIIFDKFIKMTTTKDILDINNVIKEETGSDVLYTLRGFNKGGLSRHSYNNYEFTKKLGNLKDLEDLEYYLYYNPVETYSKKAKAPRSGLVSVFNSQFMVVIEDKTKYKFYNGVKFVTEGVNNSLSKYDNLYLDGISSKLYGDSKSELSRTDVYNTYQTLIDKKLPMIRPNLYFYKNTSSYLNMPLYHSKLRFVTDSVPFMQILLRGYIDYYSTYLNFSTNQEIDFLKAIEYGSNLSYLISKNESYELANTLSSHLYATHFESNKDLILSQINSSKDVLNEINGKRIIDREVLEIGVSKVVYESGIEVYVNYNSSDVTINGISIPKLGYRVVK